MRLYVGNLAYSTTEDTLRNEFGKFGNVTSALVVIDRVSGRSRGFGFVEFSTPDEGSSAINPSASRRPARPNMPSMVPGRPSRREIIG